MKSTDSVYRLNVRVYVEDTDAGGIVFYANYLKYMERARTELIRSLGIELRASLKFNVSFVVHSVDIKYLQPARLDDQLVVTARVGKVARTYMVFQQSVLSLSGDCLTKAVIKVACVDLEKGKPRKIMPELHQALKLSQSI